MKRNEVLSKIKVLLDNVSHVTTSNKIKADIVLTEIERLGMLPPEIERLKKYEISFEGQHDYVESIEKVHAWEDT